MTAHPRRRSRRWRFTRTLSGRLIAGLVALLALASATIGVVTYLAVQRSLSRELTNQLQTATSLANNCLDGTLGSGGGDDREGDDQQAQPVQGGNATRPAPSY